jgi:hypothetical protein
MQRSIEPSLERIERQIRRRICSHCSVHPRYEASVGLKVARPCEPTCFIFQLLPLWRKLILSRDPMLCSRKRAIENEINNACSAAPKQATSESNPEPLRRYREQVISALREGLGES